MNNNSTASNAGLLGKNGNLSLAANREKAIQAFGQHCRKRKIDARQTIIHAGDTAASLYLLISGSLAVVVEDADGREMVLAHLNKHDFFGEMGLFEEQHSRSAWVVTRGPCEIGEMSYKKFIALTHEHPEMLMEITTQLSQRLASTSRKVRDLAFLDVTGRIARQLLTLSREPDAVDHADGKQIKISRQDIARLVGCSREMASRVLKSLEEQGLIFSEGRKIIIYDHALQSIDSD